MTAVVRNAAARLTVRDIRILAAHPDAVLSALAVAARALPDDVEPEPIETIGFRRPPLAVSPAEARHWLEARTRAGEKEELLNSAELAARAGLKTRQSVHDWFKKGRLIAWSGAKRGHVFPAAQLDERGHPIKGLDRVQPLFADGYSAWFWLTTPLAALDGSTPLERLKRGEIDRVIAAAHGDAQGDFA